MSEHRDPAFYRRNGYCLSECPECVALDSDDIERHYEASLPIEWPDES
jgi:hypothetical protein